MNPFTKAFTGASLLLLLTTASFAQTRSHFADSVRIHYHIPELAYAVVSADHILEMQTLGVQRVNTPYKAQATDLFRIGSNTKAITGFIAALLVKQGKISWHTRFFDLYPELKAKSKPAYHQLTLLQLLSFRTRLFPYTYTYSKPAPNQFTGNEAQQRYQFTEWFFQQKPVMSGDSIHFSNLGYIAAALMLEKVSGKPYKELVTDLAKQLNIHIGFGPPNLTDTLQPWGHDSNLKPEPPQENQKLNWLLAAGNIHMSINDYARFIQLQLAGLAGKSSLLSKKEFEFLHFGLQTFSVGWFWATDENQQTYSYNIGNPGTFLSKVYIYKNTNRAYILLTNAQTDETDEGLDVLYTQLKKIYHQ
ncbi:MAG: serine hydrolase domain-containing protein [Bacteroidota bacterium]